MINSDSESPYIEIDLSKIKHNAKTLYNNFKEKNIDVMGVTKVLSGSPEIAKVLTSVGIKYIADSRIENIKHMKDEGVKAHFVLIRTPFKSKLRQVVKYADISFNTEISIIKELSSIAISNNVIHKIVLMIEMGDLREGILERNIEQNIASIIKLKGIEIVGLGTNLTCYGGIKPTDKNMGKLSDIVRNIETKFNIKLGIVSGGNSSSFEWFFNDINLNNINNIRLGESIFLGTETLHNNPIKELYQNTITLVAEVIESNTKQSIPVGEICQNAFGEIPSFTDNGEISRVIIGIGRQEVDISGLTPVDDIDIIGSSSDHMIVDVHDLNIKVGDFLRFNINYSALLRLMGSTFINKRLFYGVE
jgi:ornithine racemase